MIETGTVDSVRVEVLGSWIVADTLSGVSTITIDDLADFSEDGGWLIINDQVIAYTDGNDATGVLTLATPLAGAAAEGTRVDVYTNGVRASQALAEVYLGDADDTVEVVIPVSMRDRVAEGMESGLAVQIEIRDDTYYLVDVLGADPLIDGSFIDPGSSIPPPAMTDGVPPTSAATGVTVEPFAIGALRISWDPPANADPITTTVFMSDATGVTALSDVAGVTPGHSLVVSSFGGGPLGYTDPYFFAVRSDDADGAGVLSAEVSAVPRQADNEDFSAETIYAIKIEAAGIQSGTMGADVAIAGSLFISDYDANGDPIPGTVRGLWSQADGFRQYGTDGRERVALDPATNTYVFRGDGEFDNLSVVNAFLLGRSNQLAEGMRLTLSAGVTPPNNPPTPLIDYNTVVLTGSGKNYKVGVVKVGSFWYTAAWGAGSTYRIEKYDASGALVDSGPSFAAKPAGITHDGTNFLVLLRDAPLVHKLHGTTFTLLDTATWPHQDGGRLPAIGWDPAASEILVAQSRATDNKVRIRRYTFGSGGGASMTNSATSPVDSAFTYSQDLSGNVLYGAFDFGANRYVFQKSAAAGPIQVISTAGVEQLGDEWPAGGALIGLAWDGSNFFGLTTDDALWRYEGGAGNKWGAGTTEDATKATWHVAEILFRTTGSLVTTRGEFATFTMRKRARVTFTLPALPTGGATPPTEGRVYLKQGSTPPDNTVPIVYGDMKLQGAATGAPPTLVVTNANWAGAADPASTTFSGSGTPAEFANGAGQVLLDAADIPLTSYTPVVTGATTNPTTNNSTLVGRYKVTQGWLEGYFHITVGSNWTTTPGSGAYSVSLPMISLRQYLAWEGLFRDLSGSQSHKVTAEINDAARNLVILRVLPTTAGDPLRSMTPGVPVAIGTGDVITVGFAYEV